MSSTSTTSPVTSSNPYLTSPPGRSRQQQILASGTEQEKLWLLEWAESQLTDEDLAKRSEALQRAQEYASKVQGEQPTVSAESKLQASVRRQVSLMLRGFVDPSPVQEDHIIAAKRLLFQAYQTAVWKRSRRKPVLVSGDHISRVLTAATYWMLGMEAPEGVTGFDPRKSLYFAGSTGNGKSSIAKAIHYASNRLANDYGVGFALGIRSMKRVVTEILADKTLTPIKDLSQGNLILDEIRTEQIGIKHFGNEVSIVSDVLYNRYDSWDFDAQQTILTTNLKPKELCDELGDDRLRVRINDQYQLVAFTGQPFRDPEMTVWS